MEEEEPDSDDGGRTKRKHADDDDEEDNEELDEEDLALLSENLGVSFPSKKKKLKRVRRLSNGESDQDEVAEDPKNAIANELFDGKLVISLLNSCDFTSQFSCHFSILVISLLDPCVTF